MDEICQRATEVASQKEIDPETINDIDWLFGQFQAGWREEGASAAPLAAVESTAMRLDAWSAYKVYFSLFFQIFCDFLLVTKS